MFLQASVILLTGGVSASVHAGLPPPPPGSRDNPPGSRLQHTVNERRVSILLECILVSTWKSSIQNESLPLMKLDLLFVMIMISLRKYLCVQALIQRSEGFYLLYSI